MDVLQSPAVPAGCPSSQTMPGRTCSLTDWLHLTSDIVVWKYQLTVVGLWLSLAMEEAHLYPKARH